MSAVSDMSHEELAAIRRKLGLTQEAFAKELGLSVRGYQFAEAGHRNISKTVAILARLLAKTWQYS
jgi:DNA-binding transcriptional regulator YiaG